MTRERSFSLRKQNRNRESKRGGVGPLLCQLYIPRCCHLEKTDDRPSRFLKDRGEGEEEGRRSIGGFSNTRFRSRAYYTRHIYSIH